MKKRVQLQESAPVAEMARGKRAYTYTETQELAEAAFDAETDG